MCNDCCSCPCCLRHRLARMEEKLDQILERETTIMAQLDDAMAAIQKIKDATDKQGAVLQAEGDSLQTVSNNLDALIAELGTTVPQPVLDGLQAQADAAQKISDAIDTQAAFSAALASKGVPNPVPVPVPTPTPEPAPVTFTKKKP